MTGLPGLSGLSVPTRLVAGPPTGVQGLSWRFREDLALSAGEII
jgi:amidase